MERLIHTNSAIPSKFPPNPLLLPRTGIATLHCLRTPKPPLPPSFSPSRTASSFPSLIRSDSDSSRFNPLCCALKGSSFSPPKLLHDCRGTNFHGTNPNPSFLQRIAQRLSHHHKVVNAGMVVLLSAIFVTFLHPIIVSPAFASLQHAANTGGPAVAVARGLFRSELLSSAWTGFFAGCLHTLSGPDHLAALAPLSIGRTRMESAAVGALWGCGHDAGQLLFGLLFLLLKDKLHIEIIRTWGTRVVGLTLLVIGAMGIREASEVPVPCVALESGECEVSEYESLTNPQQVGKKKIGFATFATGIVHGLQPDALMMILPALALPSRLAGAAFLVMFLVGTVMAMGSYTVFIGSCSEALKDRIPRITEKLTWASSLIAIALGVAILVSQIFGLSLY